MKEQWISIDERMPPHHERVLTFNGLACHCGFFVEEHTMSSAGWSMCSYNSQDDRYYVPTGWYKTKNFSIRGVTHWMPLPEPPKKDDEG